MSTLLNFRNEILAARYGKKDGNEKAKAEANPMANPNAAEAKAGDLEIWKRGGRIKVTEKTDKPTPRSLLDHDLPQSLPQRRARKPKPKLMGLSVAISPATPKTITSALISRRPIHYDAAAICLEFPQLVQQVLARMHGRRMPRPEPEVSFALGGDTMMRAGRAWEQFPLTRKLLMKSGTGGESELGLKLQAMVVYGEGAGREGAVIGGGLMMTGGEGGEAEEFDEDEIPVLADDWEELRARHAKAEGGDYMPRGDAEAKRKAKIAAANAGMDAIRKESRETVEEGWVYADADKAFDGWGDDDGWVFVVSRM